MRPVYVRMAGKQQDSSNQCISVYTAILVSPEIVLTGIYKQLEQFI